MASTSTSLGLRTRIEDVLSHLPVSTTTEYRKGEAIYGPECPSNNLYLVVSGVVGISQAAEEGSDVLLEIVRADELFGESAFLDDPRRPERATVMEKAKLMTWAVSDMEVLVAKRPRLAVALLQILAQRNAEFRRRIESFATDSVERRLARSLIRFSERLGTEEEGGSVWMMPITHEVLSRYVGTTREIITQHMNRFRKQGFVSYSREGIRLSREALQASIS